MSWRIEGLKYQWYQRPVFVKEREKKAEREGGERENGRYSGKKKEFQISWP